MIYQKMRKPLYISLKFAFIWPLTVILLSPQTFAAVYTREIIITKQSVNHPHLLLSVLDRIYWTINNLYLSDLLTLTVLVATIDAQWEGMGDVGSARYEPALLPHA